MALDRLNDEQMQSLADAQSLKGELAQAVDMIQSAMILVTHASMPGDQKQTDAAYAALKSLRNQKQDLLDLTIMRINDLMAIAYPTPSDDSFDNGCQ